jgi:hypothetical protein
MRPETYFESMIENLASAVLTLSKVFDREGLRPSGECAVLGREVSDPKGQNDELCKKQTAAAPGT